MFGDEREKTFAVSVWVASFSLGGAIGPIVGGAIITQFWWGAVFLAPIPIMGLLLIVGPTLLPEHQNTRSNRIDTISAGLTLATVLPIIYAIKQIAQGDDLRVSALTAGLGLICGVAFVRRQFLLDDPLLDLRLFRRPALSAALTINALDFLVGFGILVLVAQYLQLVLDLTPFQAGLWGVPPGLGFVLGSLLTSVFLKILRPAFVLGGGLVIASSGLALMAHAVNVHSIILITMGNTMYAVGSAPGTAIVADFVVSSAPEEQSGAASALSETVSEFGGALGIALLGSLSTLLYRHSLVSLMPADVTSYDADTALRGIGAASDLAQRSNHAAKLLSAAQLSYASSIRVTFIAAALITFATAILAVTMFNSRRTPPTVQA